MPRGRGGKVGGWGRARFWGGAASAGGVMGHRKVLPEGGEFVTVLWALAVHTGISRRLAVTLTPPDTMDRV